ncbi:hypothetical protein [Clostridium perfringens]
MSKRYIYPKEIFKFCNSPVNRQFKRKVVTIMKDEVIKIINNLDSKKR